MSEAVFDKKRKIKESLWLILAFIPYFKAKRRAWTNRGILFGVLNFAAAVVLTALRANGIRWIFNRARILSTMAGAVGVFVAVIFVAALVMELALNSDYLKLRGIMTAGEKPAHELMRNRAW